MSTLGSSPTIVIGFLMTWAASSSRATANGSCESASSSRQTRRTRLLVPGVVLGTLPSLVRGEAVEHAHEGCEPVRRELTEVLEQPFRLRQPFRHNLLEILGAIDADRFGHGQIIASPSYSQSQNR